MSGSHPLAGVQEFWDDVMDDMAATAEEYREAGWETLELHPGDVTALPTTSAAASEVDVDRLGLDVLVPGDEFETLQETVAEADFEEYDAYRASQGDVVFLVVAMKSADAGVAVLFPLYYAVSEAKVMLSRVGERGEMRTYFRPLDDSERVVFSQSDPENLLPADFDPAAVDEAAVLEEASGLSDEVATQVDPGLRTDDDES